jgi:DNA gyrase subunit A
VRETGRNAQGVKLMSIGDDERIVAFEPIGESRAAAVLEGGSIPPEADGDAPDEADGDAPEATGGDADGSPGADDDANGDGETEPS